MSRLLIPWRARLMRIGSWKNQIDMSFSDMISSPISNIERSVPSMEAISYAKTVVWNFLVLGLHQLGESQRLAMISSVSILSTSPDLSSFSLLDDLSAIFSHSNVAFDISAEMLSHRKSFQAKREKKEELDKHDQAIREQIDDVMACYNVEEADVTRLEEETQRPELGWLPCWMMLKS